MCGICGFFSFDRDKTQKKTVLEEMARSIVHRGPDQGGEFLAESVGLANRRLSIIDLEKGQQPIFNEDGKICVVFNGEIYNQHHLRDELIAQGHSFSTRSDTEVIVHLYEEYKEGCVEYLNGMFAFALWDSNEGRGLLARDRLGIKPLFYTQKKGCLVFGSEIKALLTHPEVARNLEPDNLSLYLILRYLPDETTIFQGIKKLLPGNILIFDLPTDTWWTQAYWEPTLSEEPAASISENEVVSELGGLLRDAVKIRLMSDVPFGAFLSGGLDSSAVVALMSQEMADPVQTFSIGFSENKKLDETRQARTIARAFGTQHREIDCTASKVELLPKLLYHFDEPFADPIILPAFQVAELAAQHVKVVLTGEGADELFGGYTRFVTDGSVRRFRQLPPFFRRWLMAMSHMIPAQVLREKVNRFLEMSMLDDATRFLRWTSAFDSSELQCLYRPGFLKNSAKKAVDLYERHLESSRKMSLTNQMLFCDLKIRLPECMLARTDRMSMAVSLEARTPFLDHRLVEQVLQLPAQFKVRGHNEKFILKKALSKVLPATTIRRKKQGLAVPFALWTQFGIEKPIRRILSRERIEKRGVFQADYVQGLLKNWGPNASRHSQLIWSLLCLELWWRISLEGELDPETPLSEVA